MKPKFSKEVINRIKELQQERALLQWMINNKKEVLQIKTIDIYNKEL